MVISDIAKVVLVCYRDLGEVGEMALASKDHLAIYFLETQANLSIFMLFILYKATIYVFLYRNKNNLT